MNDEEQTKAQMATLRQEMKNLRSGLQEHWVNAAEGNPRQVDPNGKGRQNGTPTLQLVPHKWTYSKLVPEEDTRRTESNRKREDAREKKSRLLRTQTKNEDQVMDQNNGLEAKIFKKETRTTLTMNLQEIPPQRIRIYLPDRTSHMRTTFRIMENHMINAQISDSIEAMEIDLGMDVSTIKMETGETMEIFFKKTSHRIFRTANQEVINFTMLLSADLATDLRLVLHLTSKNFHKIITRRHSIWFASPQLTIPIINYQTFAR